jgi:hypothetical protein
MSITSDTLISAPKTSPAELISKALDGWEILDAVMQLVKPGEETKHFQRQLVHQRKRQTVSTNALKRLAKFYVGVSTYEELQKLLNDARYSRLCTCAVSPLTDEKVPDTAARSYSDHMTKKDVSIYCDAIKALGTMAPLPTELTKEVIYPALCFLSEFLPTDGTRYTSATSEEKSLSLTPAEIAGFEWSCRRLSISGDPPKCADKIYSAFDSIQLPFKVFHGLTVGLIDINEIRRDVPFKAESLQTRDGKAVTERRETCWMADPGVGGLAYSG